MSVIPHSDVNAHREAESFGIALNCGVITVSDTRTAATDSSGKLIRELLVKANHRIFSYQIVRDEPEEIQRLLREWGKGSPVEIIILSGGTGIAPRDNTYEVVAGILTKILPGFGEIFRFLSYQAIGSRAIASRAIAGIYGDKLVFSLPGSTHAVKLALEKLILPELNHLIRQLRS